MDNIDFLPKRIKQKRGRKRVLKRQGAVLMLGAVALMAIAHVNQAAIARANAELADLQDRQHRLAETLKVIPDLTANLAEAAIKQRINRELGSRLTVNAVLAELGRLLPPAGSLTALEYNTVEIRPKASPVKTAAAIATHKNVPAEKRVRLTLVGVAPTDVDVANFIGQLSGCPLLAEVNMGYAKMVAIDQGRRTARSFQVNCLMAR